MTSTRKPHSIISRGLSATKGAMNLESALLKSRVDKLLAKLGKEVYVKLVDMNEPTVGREDRLTGEILKEIEDLRSKIGVKEKEYRAIGKSAEMEA